jgi:CRP-like cAMP-binding protein
MGKAQKINTQSLLNTKLFYNYREDLFDTHYFNCFKAIKKQKSEYLFKQNEKREYIFFIKKGDVQIEHISTWKELDKIIGALGNQSLSEKKVFTELIRSSEKLKNFTEKKQKFNISICSSGEIVGFEEHIYPNSDIFMFSAICLSECEIFALEIHFIDKMISERFILDNYTKLKYEKKSKLYKRLLNLKSNIFYHYNNLIKDKFIRNAKKKLIKSSEKQRENIFKSKNKLNIKKKMICFTPEIKMELSNQSVEKKNINKEAAEMKLSLQNRKTNNSSLFATINMKQGRRTLEKHNLKLRTLYDTENDNQSSHRETKSKFYTSTNSKLYRMVHPVSNLNIRYNRNPKNVKVFSQTLKTLNSRSLSKKAKIKFSLKGRVPNLLYDHANAFNKVIDKLISKEKDLYNLSTENKKNINKENNKDENSNNKDFISHLELLGVDKVLNSIIIKNKKKSFENKNENCKNVCKLKLMPLTVSTNFKYKYNI